MDEDERIPPSGRSASGRPGWDEYFLDIARTVATRATCSRASVGAVLTRDRRILTTGYNGAPRGVAHCTDAGCMLVDGHCLRATHAEANAIVQGALHGVGIAGATAYCTQPACLSVQVSRACADANPGRAVPCLYWAERQAEVPP